MISTPVCVKAKRIYLWLNKRHLSTSEVLSVVAGVTQVPAQ